MKFSLAQILRKIPRYVHDSVMILYWRCRSLFFREKDKYKDAWLICERGIEARDNGFAFFQYMRQHFPDKKVFYLIDHSQQIDYQQVKSFGNILEYSSKEHLMAIFYSKCLLSTHVGYITPWSYVCHKTFFSWLSCPKFILLNHGITKEDMSDKLNKYVTGVDLFIAANKQDYEMLTDDSRYGYKPNEIALTGYARYDKWKRGDEKQQILFMPTWRNYLVNKSISSKNNPTVVDSFMSSIYYKSIQNLLNNERLDSLLTEYKMQLVFYPHYEMQSALPLWTTNSRNITFADKQHNDIPTLMRESKVMITDYSGVGFDFAYMYKPVIYYQFDQEEYYDKHYYRSDRYSIEQDGLGAVLISADELLDELERTLQGGCEMSAVYRKRVDSFFTYHDINNCERIYKAIINITNEK